MSLNNNLFKYIARTDYILTVYFDKERLRADSLGFDLNLEIGSETKIPIVFKWLARVQIRILNKLISFFRVLNILEQIQTREDPPKVFLNGRGPSKHRGISKGYVCQTFAIYFVPIYWD